MNSSEEVDDPLTLGTAGHIDHGKTALVAALTGVNTDRLEEERRRGISIELGFALMSLPDGRPISVVDVPGHQRLVRAMVAGSAGVDLFLLVIAADDGVMPQTHEHWAVLQGLGIDTGVIALNKTDLATVEMLEITRKQAAQLAPGVPIVEVSARTGDGIEDLRRVVADVARDRRVDVRARRTGPPVLHIDRVFSLQGIGTVVTGTLSEGSLEVGSSVRILPQHRIARVRSVEVHGRSVKAAGPGQRVAVNIAGVRRNEVMRGNVLTDVAGAQLRATYRLDVALDLKQPETVAPRRVQVHHGTAQAPARVVDLGTAGLAQVRLEARLIAGVGDRLIIRQIAPPDTLGGAVVIDPGPLRHGAQGPEYEALKDAAYGPPEEILRRAVGVAPDGLTVEITDWRRVPKLGFALQRFEEQRWRDARRNLELAGEIVESDGRLRMSGVQGIPNAQFDVRELDSLARDVLDLLDTEDLRVPTVAGIAEQLGATRDDIDAGLRRLEEAGLVVRLANDIHYRSEHLETIDRSVIELIASRGSISLPELRDALNISRRYAQAILGSLDSRGVTVRHGERRVLRRPSSHGRRPARG